MAKRIEEQVPVKGEPAPDDVERRAYELYEARGGEPGADLDDWLRAENELRESADGIDDKGA